MFTIHNLGYQGIVDSWPADVDDRAARADWGFSPDYDFDRAFRELMRRHETVIVEGAGGLLVPVRDGFTMADLATLEVDVPPK